MYYIFVPLFLLSVNGEILTYTNSTPPATDVIECQDENTECVINCDFPSICSNKEIHCHNTSQLQCTINLNAINSAQYAIIYTHSSSPVYLNGNNDDCGTSIHVHAYQHSGTQLFITSSLRSFSSSTIYGPVGYGSVLWIKGGYTAFQSATIYEDWSTTIRLQPEAYGPFKSARIYNIFDSSGLPISRSDYATADMAYRASVHMIACNNPKDAFTSLIYNGVNHGDWYIRAMGGNILQYATIYATTDNRVNESVPYALKFYGFAGRGSMYVGATADVYYEGIGQWAMAMHNIYAKRANSLNIYCHTSGTCDRIAIECPEHGGANSCNWICDVDCTGAAYGKYSNIEIPTPDVYGCDSLYLSGRIVANIYCGYGQSNEFCDYTSDGVTPTQNCSSGCDNGCQFDNAIAPISIKDEIDLFCNEDPIVFPSTTTTTTTSATTLDPITTSSAATTVTTEPISASSAATTATILEVSTTSYVIIDTTDISAENKEGKVEDEAEVDFDVTDSDDELENVESTDIQMLKVVVLSGSGVIGVLCCLWCLYGVRKRYRRTLPEKVIQNIQSVDDEPQQSAKQGTDIIVHTNAVQPLDDASCDNNHKDEGQDTEDERDEELYDNVSRVSRAEGGNAIHTGTTGRTSGRSTAQPPDASCDNNSKDDEQESDDEDLWNNMHRVDPTSGELPHNVSLQNVDKCMDCSQIKKGIVWDGDGLFYCNDCFALYSK